MPFRSMLTQNSCVSGPWVSAEFRKIVDQPSSHRVLGIFVQASWNFSASIFLCERWYSWCGEMAVKSEFEKRIGEVNETIFYRT